MRLLRLPLTLAFALLPALGCNSILGHDDGAEAPDSDGGASGTDAGGVTPNTGEGVDTPDASEELPLACSSTTVRSYQPLGRATQRSAESSLLWLGDSMGVVWEEAAASADATGSLYFAKIDGGGRVLSPRQLGPGDDPVLARGGNETAVWWRQGKAVYKRTIDDAGQWKSPAVKVYEPTSGPFAVAWTGSEYVLSLDGADALQYEVHLLRVDAAGRPQGNPLRVAQSGNNSLQNSMAWTGSALALAYTDTRGGAISVYYAQFDKDLRRLSNDTRLSQPSVRGSFPSVAAQATGGAVVCYQQKMSEENQDIFCSRIDEAGAVTNVSRITNNAFDSLNPRTISHGRFTWVVWDDRMQYSPTVQWQFLNETGAPVLEKPKDTAIWGWRVGAAEGADGLYWMHFASDDSETVWSAECGVANCF